MRSEDQNQIRCALPASGNSAERARMSDHRPLRPNVWDYGALAYQWSPLMVALNYDFIPLIGPYNEGERYTKLMKLAAIGFLALGSAKNAPSNALGAFTIGNKQLTFTTSGRLVLQSAILTPAGRQVLELVAQSPPDPEMVKALGEWLSAQAANVSISDVDDK
jgi:hypothetical protein